MIQLSPLPLSFPTYFDFAQAIYNTGILSDPWIDGRERFSLQGVILSQNQADALEEAAERVAYLHQELVEILLNHPTLMSDFYELTPFQQAMWESSGGLWHGIARADLFVLPDGHIQCCELNSDTPSGEPEAVLLNQLLHAAHGAVIDPNARLEASFLRMLRESHAKRTDQPLSSVAIIYPTELTEDLSMILLYTRWLQAAGINVVTGSPFNLRRTRRGIEVLGHPVDLIIRHYKTDWWGERDPVWADAEDFPDPEPLFEPLGMLISAEMAGEVTLVNPLGSVITQNKLSLAFFWEYRSLFSEMAQTWIRTYLPETHRLSYFSIDRLRKEQSQWVLKSDYGCEGAETICGPFVSPETWQRSLDLAIPQHFVAQRFFEAQPDDQGRIPNYGVYLIGGSASGYFTRLSSQSTEYSALTVPTFLSPEE
ncbi:MAG TPA: glutathionylspermidine synthase family protein [Acidobacteriota bacterium]|nr:glutathionylspermidine synthase family protein [Acidobacteriota bacterium]